jgi:hypothetical protein
MNEISYPWEVSVEIFDQLDIIDTTKSLFSVAGAVQFGQVLYLW